MVNTWTPLLFMIGGAYAAPAVQGQICETSATATPSDWPVSTVVGNADSRPTAGCTGALSVPLDIVITTDPSRLITGMETTVDVAVSALAALTDVRIRYHGIGHALVLDAGKKDYAFLGAGETVRFAIPVEYKDLGDSSIVVTASAVAANVQFEFSKRTVFNVLLRQSGSLFGGEVPRHLRIRAVRDDLKAGRIESNAADARIRELTRLDGVFDQTPFERIEPTPKEQEILDRLRNLPEEIPQSDKQSSLRGGVNIRVRGVVQWRDENDVNRPVYGMTVQVRDDEVVGSEKVREMVTDQNGQYDTDWFNHDDGLGAGNPDIFVRFRSENGAIDVEDGCFACPTYENDSAVRDEFPGGEIIENFTCANFGTGPACSVLTGLTWISVYASNLNNGQFLDKVRADWPGDSGSSNYNCAPACRINVHPDDHWDWDVLHHEYGHHVMDEFDFEDSPGGPHNINSCHAVTRGDKDDGMKLAWAEGWPTYFALAGQQQLDMALLGVPRVGDVNYADTINQNFSYSIEANSGGIVPNSTRNGRGEDNELAVQRVLWDLFDSNNDSRDSVAASDQWLFDVFDNSGPHSLNAAWAPLRAQLSDAEDLAFGNVLTDHEIGPRPIAPADGTEITLANATFTWDPNVGCGPTFAGDLFELVFYRASNQTRLFSIPGLTNTSYTLTPAEFATLQIGGPEILWVVEGRNTTSPSTGPYLGANSSVVAYTPPSNDSCGSATVVGDGLVSGTTNGASADGSDTCLPGTRPDAWFSYTATCTGRLEVDTCGSASETMVSIHDACPGTFLNEETCDAGCADICGGDQACAARAETTVARGETYLVRAAATGDTGDFSLTLTCSANADACEEARPIAIGDTVTGTTIGADTASAPVCDGFNVDSPGVWYAVLGNGNLLTASLCNSATSFDTKLSVYCASCESHACRGANDDTCGLQSEVSWCAAPGAVYFILVHGYNGASGDFELEVRDDGPGGCGPFYLSCAPANSFCSQAVAVGSGTYFGDNTNASTSTGVSCRTSNSDVWYRYTPNCHGFVTISTCGGGGTLVDTVLTVFNECSSEELACNDDFPGCEFRSQLTVPVRADDPILIRVADYGTTIDRGTFPLTITGTGMIAPLNVPPPGLYVTDGHGFLEDHVLHIDPVTGYASDVGFSGLSELSGLAYSGTLGLLYGINDAAGVDEKVTVDTFTGSASVYNTTILSSIKGMAFNVNTLTMYGSDASSGVLLRLDPFGTGDSVIGAIGFTAVRGLAYDPNSNTLYGADTDTDQLITIDAATGAGTVVGPFGGDFGQIEGLAFDPQTDVLYGVQNDGGTDGRLVVIDSSTGTATQTGPNFSDLGPSALAFVPGLPDGTVDGPYSGQIPIAGGCPPYIVSSVSGLPAGLEINSAGFVHGTPAESGVFAINFTLGDSNISTLPINVSTPLRIHPSNDFCMQPRYAQEGELLFSTVGATTDGPDEPSSCDANGDSQVGSDVWFCHIAECTGDLTISLCGSSYDTKLAVYAGCGCPSSPPLACNDDFCGGTGLQSEVTIPAVAGQSYMIRIGGYAGSVGSGTLSIRCAECRVNSDCNDGNLCTENTCDQNRCQTSHLTCDDGNLCTTDSCAPATGCANTPIVCDDENACTTESCNPINGLCAVTPVSCDDADVCNGVESCNSESGCVAGTPLICDDGDACNGTESCDPVSGCQSGTPPTCDDGDPCTLDACDPVSGCLHTAGIDCNSNGVLDDCDVEADADGSGVVDVGDWPMLRNCLTGPCTTPPCDQPVYADACCAWFDHDADNDIDAEDVAHFQWRQGWSGAECIQSQAGLVNWWSGDETFGDWAGPNDAVPINGAAFASGYVEAGISTGPGGVYAQTGTPIAITGSSPRTLCAWIKSSSDYASSCCATPVSYGAAYTGGGFGIFMSFGEWWFWGYQNDINTAVATDTDWNHHCLTYDGAEVIYYMNGNPIASQPKSLNTGGSPLVIGDGFDHRFDTPFEGVIDELMLYDWALQPVEVRLLYEAGSAGVCR